MQVALLCHAAGRVVFCSAFVPRGRLATSGAARSSDGDGHGHGAARRGITLDRARRALTLWIEWNRLVVALSVQRVAGAKQRAGLPTRHHDFTETSAVLRALRFDVRLKESAACG